MPWQSAPPNASPAPSPLTTVTARGATRTVLRRARQHAVAAELHDRQLGAGREHGIRCRIRILDAHRDAALLEVADDHGALPEYRSGVPAASVGISQKAGR